MAVLKNIKKTLLIIVCCIALIGNLLRRLRLIDWPRYEVHPPSPDGAIIIGASNTINNTASTMTNDVRSSYILPIEEEEVTSTVEEEEARTNETTIGSTMSVIFTDLPKRTRKDARNHLPRVGRFVTAFSEDHYWEATAWVRSLQAFIRTQEGVTDWKIVIYDLVGDLMDKDISSWCYVDYRPFRNMTSHERASLTNSAWKPHVIHQVLEEVPAQSVVIWGDASARLNPVVLLNYKFWRQQNKLGVFAGYMRHNIANFTHPDMVEQLSNNIMGLKPRRNIYDYIDAPSINGASQVYRKNMFVMNKIMKPWLACASNKDCIMPRGASGFRGADSHKDCVRDFEGHCHRGDQSALSIILWEVFAHSVEYLWDGARFPVTVDRSIKSKMSGQDKPKFCP